MNVTFSGRELRDFVVAWIALGVAFTFFFNPGITYQFTRRFDPTVLDAFAYTLTLSLLTVGIGFLLHELAHKVVAVRFGQVAEFRADYTMLGLAIVSGLAGFLFAAPGAVHHRGRISKRENGLIAVAGPITNLVLATIFLPLEFASGFPGDVGSLGVTINLLLAAFNMIPFGPLDGRKVLVWNRIVFVLVFGLCLVLGLGRLFGFLSL